MRRSLLPQLRDVPTSTSTSLQAQPITSSARHVLVDQDLPELLRVIRGRQQGIARVLFAECLRQAGQELEIERTGGSRNDHEEEDPREHPPRTAEVDTLSDGNGDGIYTLSYTINTIQEKTPC